MGLQRARGYVGTMSSQALRCADMQVHAARARGRPYTIVFVGVNGVGKSTNLAKICYWLLQNDVKVRRQTTAPDSQLLLRLTSTCAANCSTPPRCRASAGRCPPPHDAPRRSRLWQHVRQLQLGWGPVACFCHVSAPPRRRQTSLSWTAPRFGCIVSGSWLAASYLRPLVMVVAASHPQPQVRCDPHSSLRARGTYSAVPTCPQVQIAACDTFRSGAVEQLKTHCGRLGVPLYERGYERDPAKVAAEAVKAAARDGIDVVLVDTAGEARVAGHLAHAAPQHSCSRVAASPAGPSSCCALSLALLTRDSPAGKLLGYLYGRTNAPARAQVPARFVLAVRHNLLLQRLYALRRIPTQGMAASAGAQGACRTTSR